MASAIFIHLSSLRAIHLYHLLVTAHGKAAGIYYGSEEGKLSRPSENLWQFLAHVGIQVVHPQFKVRFAKAKISKFLPMFNPSSLIYIFRNPVTSAPCKRDRIFTRIYPPADFPSNESFFHANEYLTRLDGVKYSRWISLANNKLIMLKWILIAR